MPDGSSSDTCLPQFESQGQGLLVRAPAKINLTLLIAGKRPDGFHEIETHMAKITYYDEVLIEPGQKTGIELICKGPHWAPTGPDNLVYRAAERLLNAKNSSASIRVTLTKNIPAGTGLGSASSDAAATLLGLNRWLQLDCPPEKLHAYASELGSDVPFFLGGPIAYCTGRGEKLHFLPKKFDFQVVLCIPNVTISTEKVYNNYQHDQGLYQRLHDKIQTHMRKNRIDLATKMCANMLAYSCYDLCEGLDELRCQFESLGLGPVNLTGSGSVLYCCYTGNKKLAPITNYVNITEGPLYCKYVIVTSNRW